MILSGHFQARSQNTIRLIISFKIGKMDTNYLNLIIENPDISGHFNWILVIRKMDEQSPVRLPVQPPKKHPPPTPNRAGEI